MNSLLTSLTYLKTLFELDTRVTTVIEGEGEEIDTYKTNQYPLVNLSIGTSTVGIGEVKHQFVAHVLTQRSFSKVASSDRFNKNDNKLTNLDLTSDILIKAITNLKLKNNTSDIELSNEPTLEAIKFDFLNTLDGYSCTFELSVTNNDDVCSY
jgi:hypothetical protein